MHANDSGFSLTELMITVAIVAILAAVAYPSYTSYILRSNRTDASTALLKMAAAQEKYYLQNNTYATTLAALGTTKTEHDRYALAIPTANTTTFTATATAKGPQAKDTDCAVLQITETGARTAKKSDNTSNDAACWR